MPSITLQAPAGAVVLVQEIFARADGVHWDGRSAAIGSVRSAEPRVVALG